MNYLSAVLYMVLMVAPCLFLLVRNLGPITEWICSLAQKIITEALPGKQMAMVYSEYPPFGKIFSLSFEAAMPQPSEILISMTVVVIVIALLVLSSLRGRPLMIYLLFSFMVHIISCVFYIFERDSLIYTGAEFSELFMKQQISIWILFIVFMGIIVSFFGGKGFFYRIGCFFGVLAYSAVVSVIRYIVFMFILARYSVLYMADMFFITGPIFDFLYLVMFYVFFSSKVQSVLDSPDGEDEWRWL